MFGLFDAFGQNFRRISGFYWNASLSKDRAFIHALGDDVDGASGLGIASLDGAGVGIQARIERQ